MTNYNKKIKSRGGAPGGSRRVAIILNRRVLLGSKNKYSPKIRGSSNFLKFQVK